MFVDWANGELIQSRVTSVDSTASDLLLAPVRPMRGS